MLRILFKIMIHHFPKTILVGQNRCALPEKPSFSLVASADPSLLFVLINDCMQAIKPTQWMMLWGKVALQRFILSQDKTNNAMQ